MLHFSSLRLFQRELTATICVFSLIPGLPLGSWAQSTMHDPDFPPRHFAWPSPSAAWTLPWHPQFPGFAFSGRLSPLQGAGKQLPHRSWSLPHGQWIPLSVATWTSSARLLLPSLTMTLTLPMMLPHPTAQCLGFPHLGVSWPAQMTNPDIPLGNHSLLNSFWFPSQLPICLLCVSAFC